MANVGLNKAIRLATSIMLYMGRQTGLIVEESVQETSPGHIVCIPNSTATTNVINESEHISQLANGHGSDDQVPQLPQSTPISIVNEEDMPQALPDDLKNESKIALALFAVSAACVLLLLGELKDELNNPSVGVYTTLSYISLFSSIIMFLLILYRPNIRCLVKIVMFTMYVSLGSLLYASVSAYFALVL